MRVVCDQCSSTYKVPNAKLTKPINKATCRSCGARLLIPKPQPGADPEERVVVPAVPATSGVGDQGLVSPAEADDDDKTMPVVRKVTPAPSTPEQDDVAFDDGEATTVQRRPVPLTVERSSASKPSSAASDRASETRPAPRPSPAPKRAPAPGASNAPGPRGLGFAFAGAVLAMIGMVLLSIPLGPEVAVAGRFLGFSGAATAMLALGLSNFGQQDAKGVLSLVVGLAFGGILAGVLSLGDLSGLRPSSPSAGERPTPADPVQADVGADGSEASAAPDATDDGGGEAVEEDSKPRERTRSRETTRRSSAPAAGTSSAEPSPAKTERPRASSTPEPTTSRPARRAPEPEPEPEPAAPPPRRSTPTTERDVLEPEPEEAPAPLPAERTRSTQSSGSSAPETDKSDGLMATVPASVIQTIVTTNVGVKRCFFEALKSREIQKPITVSTTFNLSASGSASNLRVNNDGLGGSTLERCLDGAFRKMTFPKAAKGGPVNFPFKL